jgi:serine/threonine protein phosphatase PrpC
VQETRQLRVTAAFCSQTGRRERNQDFVGLSADTVRSTQGYVAAIADGVSLGNGGRVAAELTVRSFMEGYYNGSPTQGVARNAIHAIGAVNAWLHGMGKADPALKHASTTLTAVVLSGRDAHVLHIGDTRAWHLHDEQLTRLTEDHTLQQPERDHILIRAIGMEPTARLDHHVHSLRAHDRLLLTTDGVHSVLPERQLRALLLRRRSPGEDAVDIVDAAIAAGSQDNASCLIVDVLEVPEVAAPELLSHFASLPLCAPPAPGATLDDFAITSVISSGRYSQLLLARDLRSNTNVVLKFPQQNVASASTYHSAFVREAWVSARLHSPYLGETIELPPDRQTCLYSAMPYYEGQTLEQRIAHGARISLTEGLAIAQKLIKAVAVLHRAGIIHRDIKPDNVLLEKDGGLKLIDLGVVRLPLLEDFPSGDIPGTPSYMAPELFDGRTGDEFSDQFALGVTLYRMFTGRYPYGEIEPFTRPRFTQAAPLARHRPDLPAWLGHVLSRTLQPDPAARFGDALEISMEIDSGQELGEQHAMRKPSLYERNPLRFWQLVSALLAVALMISLAMNALHRS